MQKLIFDDFLKRRYATPSALPLFAILSNLPNFLGNGVWLAGGAVRRTISGDPLNSDLDFFFKNEESYKKFYDALLSNHSFNFKIIAENEKNASIEITIGNDKVKIQLIKIQFYSSPREIIESFDFTICQFVFDGKFLYCGEFALWDLGSRRLAVHKITYPVASMRRMLKYTSQGFYACNGCLRALLESGQNGIEETATYID